MNPSDRLPIDHLSDMERRLAGWTPAPTVSGRDRILFEAGVAAGRRQVNRGVATALITLMLGTGGWALNERAERGRLELALAAQSRVSDRSLTERRPSPPLGLEPVAPAPMSYAALSRLLASGGELPDLVAPVSAQSLHPTRLGPVLTPFSSYHAAEASNL